MKIKVDGISIEEDKKYYRINILLETHKFHSEKLNFSTAADLLAKMVKI